MLLCEASAFWVVYYTAKSNWYMRQELLLFIAKFLLSFSSRGGEGSRMFLTVLRFWIPRSAVPNQMNGSPCTFMSLPVTISTALGSWRVFSYSLWPTFCHYSHYCHQNATVHGSLSSAYIFLLREKKEIDLHRMTLLMWRRKRSLRLRLCTQCHPGSDFVFSALISSFGADCLQWAPENWVWFTWSKQGSVVNLPVFNRATS